VGGKKTPPSVMSIADEKAGDKTRSMLRRVVRGILVRQPLLYNVSSFCNMIIVKVGSGLE
jgi:hypothetical protein